MDRRQARADAALVAILAAVLGLLLLGPLLPHLGQRFLGLEYVDHHGTQWFYWYAEQTVLHGASPFHSDLFFHPWGKDVLGHTGSNLLDAWLALPLRLLLGPVAGYDVFVVLGLLANGLAFLPLARHAAADPLARGAGALLVATLPYALAEAVEGRPTQAFLALPLLYLAALLHLGRRPGLRAPLAAGLLLALSGYQYWYYAFFGGVVALAHGLWTALRPPPGAGGPVRVLGRHALVAAVALALVAPLALPLLGRMDEVPGLLRVEEWGLYGAAPVVDEELRVGLMLWQPLRGEAGYLVQPEGSLPAFLHRMRWTPAVLLPLLAVAAWRPGRLRRGAWLAMAAAAALLALGPALLVGGVALPNLLYIWLVQAIEPLRRLWWPARAYAFLGPLLVLSAVAGLAAVRARLGATAGRLAAVAVVAGQALHLRSQELLPLPAWDATVPAGYRCLAEGPPGAVIDLPFAWTQGHLYYQTAHGRPMLGGMLENNAAFTPPELVALREENSLVARLIAITGGGIEGEATPVEEVDRQELLDLGYRYVVLQEDALTQARRARSLLDNAVRSRNRDVRRQLERALGQPVYDDARISIYDLRGEGSPCADRPVQPDLVSPGPTAVDAADLVRWDPEGSPFRWFFAEEDGGGEEADPRGLLWGAEEAAETEEAQP